jgi:hypothetical protein
MRRATSASLWSPGRGSPGRGVKLAATAVLLAGTGAAVYGSASAPASGQQVISAGPNATFASIPVSPATGQSGTPGGQGITVGPAAGGPPVKNKFYPCRGAVAPKSGFKINPRFPLPTPPPGSITHTNPPTFGCAYIVAFSNVKKLNGAALIGPGEAALQFGTAEIIDSPLPYNYLEIVNTGQLDYGDLHELPPAKATFLAFGFMPVSATMRLTEMGTLNAVAVGDADPLECKESHNCVTVTKIYTEVTLRIYNVNVNGVPLNVGPGCQTPPFTIELTGKSPKYSIETGGPLYGTVKIPQFTGCGVGETLDTIFNGSISGPGNFISAQQGTLCTPNSGSGCGNKDTGPSIPKPVH